MSEDGYDKEIDDTNVFVDEDRPIEKSKSKYELQKEYCEKNNKPLFAPKICFFCRKDFWNRISEEEAMTELVTGCPYCSHSFCE